MVFGKKKRGGHKRGRKASWGVVCSFFFEWNMYTSERSEGEDIINQPEFVGDLIKRCFFFRKNKDEFPA